MIRTTCSKIDGEIMMVKGKDTDQWWAFHSAHEHVYTNLSWVLQTAKAIANGNVKLAFRFDFACCSLPHMYTCRIVNRISTAGKAVKPY